MPPFDFYTNAMNPAYNWQENWAQPQIAGASLNVSLPNVTGVTGRAYINTPSVSFKDRVSNYFNKYGSNKYNLTNSIISGGADLAGNLINSNGLSSTAGNIMSGVGNIVGNIPGPIGWAGKGLALAGQAVNALWGHKFNDANVAAAESANRERNNWQFGDYSNTDALLAGSMANVQLGNVSKGFLGKEGPFSNAVTNKMNQINNDRMQANLRANNSELNAYNNYQTGMVRNAIAGDSMGNVNAAASGGPLNMISGTMTPFGNRYFANGGFTHGGMFTNGFVQVNNGGSHEQNPNQGVQYGVDPQGTPNMVEEGETIFNDYVFSNRIKFPKRYKDEFALGGKIWKKSFADVSKIIAKESEERPNDPISQRSLKAMGGKLADIQEEVKAKQALSKMDPREVMAMLQQLATMQQSGEQQQMEEQQIMEDPYQQQMMQESGMEEQPIMAADGGNIYIKPNKRGTFTAAANKRGMGVQEFASQVLSNPDNYSTSMVKKANFARNAAKWHACGGKLHGCGGRINKFESGGSTIPSWMRYIPSISEIQPNVINIGDYIGLFNRQPKQKTEFKPILDNIPKEVTPNYIPTEQQSRDLTNLINNYSKQALNLYEQDKANRDYIRMQNNQNLINSYNNENSFNLFKTGGKSTSKYKSDNDWEKMYELSKPIYQQFIDAGIDPMIAVGVLGNIALESSFNHKASNKTHWGYVQNDKALTDYVTSNYGGYGPQHQIQYLIDGLTKGIKGSDKGKGKAIQKRFTNFLNASKGLTDPADIAAMWDKYYEISGGQAMYDRRNYATKFWDKYNVPQTAQEAQEVQQPQIIEPYQLQQQQVLYTPVEQPQSYQNNNYLSPYSNYISYMQPYVDNMQSYLGNPNQNLQFANGGFINRFDIGGGFSRELPDDIQKAFKNTDWGNKKSVMNLLYLMTKDNIIDHRYAGILADSVLTGRFDDMFKNVMREKDLTSSDILSNILSGSVSGIARPIKEKDKKTGKEVEKEVVDEWLGPQAYNNLVGNTGYLNYDYNLNRGLMNGLEDLTYKFNPTTSSRQDVLDYLFNYATTDTQKQASYKNARTKELEDAARKEWDDWKYGEGTIPEGMIVPDNDGFPTYRGVKYSDIKGVDPNSEEFAKLNEAEQNLARTAYLRDKFTNDAEYIKYAEKFQKEADDAEALRKKDEELQKALHPNALPTWMRYAPLAFSSIATLTDALGLTNKPDLTPYNQLIGQSDRLNKTPSVRSHPVFQPMVYKPGNQNYLLGAADNIFASTLRAMNDTNGGNIGAANAGNVIAMNNAMANRAKIHESLANQNMQDMKAVLDYNNKGAFQDATASLEAQKINSANLQNAQRFGYQALSDALRYYQTEQQAANAAKQVNLTHAVNSWANLGRENMYMNMINSNKAWDYMMNPNGTSVYKYLTDMFS